MTFLQCHQMARGVIREILFFSATQPHVTSSSLSLIVMDCVVIRDSRSENLKGTVRPWWQFSHCKKCSRRGPPCPARARVRLISREAKQCTQSENISTVRAACEAHVWAREIKCRCRMTIHTVQVITKWNSFCVGHKTKPNLHLHRPYRRVALYWVTPPRQDV